MAITDEGNGMVMPVSPMYGGGYGNSFGNGDGSWWILLLFILLGGWGNGMGGYGGGNAGFVDNTVQRGFDQSAIMNGITGVGNNVVSGFGDTATNLCGGFAGVTSAITNGFAQAEIAANARAMSDMQQMFALQSQFAQCCCDNRLANCQTQNLISNEAASTRSAIQNGVQSVLDTICQDKIDEKNDKIIELQNRVNMAALQASQTAQTAEILSRLPATTTTGA
jgi:hypothetical protein